LPCQDEHRCCFRQGPLNVPAPLNADTDFHETSPRRKLPNSSRLARSLTLPRHRGYAWSSHRSAGNDSSRLDSFAFLLILLSAAASEPHDSTVLITLIKSSYEIQIVCFDPVPVAGCLGAGDTRSSVCTQLDSRLANQGMLSSQHGWHERRQGLLHHADARMQQPVAAKTSVK